MAKVSFISILILAMRLPALALSLLVFLFSCSISMTPEYYNEIKRHRSLAILPFEVGLYQIEELKYLSPGQLKEREKELGCFFQCQAYGYFSRRQPKNRQVYVVVQDVAETNRKLGELGLSSRQARLLGERELARFLGVDAFIYGSIDIRPDFDAANNAYVAGYASYGSVADMMAVIDIRIADSNTSSVIWQYREPNKGYSRREASNDTLLFNNLFMYPLSRLSYKAFEQP